MTSLKVAKVLKRQLHTLSQKNLDSQKMK